MDNSLMTEQQEQPNSKSTLLALAAISTLLSVALGLFGILFHSGYLSGLGIPNEFFPLPVNEVPVQAYLGILTLLNRIARIWSSDAFFVIPALLIGSLLLVALLIKRYMRQPAWVKSFESAGRRRSHAITLLTLPVLCASAVYLLPRAVFVIVSAAVLLPMTGYFIGAEWAAVESLNEAEGCVEGKPVRSPGCVAIHRAGVPAVRGYILASSGGLVAIRSEGKTAVRSTEKDAVYEVIASARKPISLGRQN